MAEVGIKPAAKRHCENPHCGAVIPKWRAGRKVSSKTRYCSPRCAQKARRASDSQNGTLNAKTMKKAA
jgi:hypothetical protein